MARLSTEQLAQIKLLAHTLREMDDELGEMSQTWMAEARHQIRYTRVKLLKVLAMHGIVAIIDPPALPDSKHPF